MHHPDGMRVSLSSCFRRAIDTQGASDELLAILIALAVELALISAPGAIVGSMLDCGWLAVEGSYQRESRYQSRSNSSLKEGLKNLAPYLPPNRTSPIVR